MLYLSTFKSEVDKIRKACYNPTISERNNFLPSIFFIDKKSNTKRRRMPMGLSEADLFAFGKKENIIKRFWQYPEKQTSKKRDLLL